MTQHHQFDPASGTVVADAAIRALTIIRTAFVEDPPVRWLYPEAESYAAHFAAFAAALGAPAFRDVTFRLSDASAALWLRPGAAPDEVALCEIIERSIPTHRQADVFAVVEAMDSHHPAEPHWYLPIIGTRPDMQGRGFGAALIAPVLEICDQTGVPAYLEATTECSRALYARLGFEPTGRIQVADCPPLTAMVRKPR